MYPQSIVVDPDALRQETQFDLVCFSHLRWDYVQQRPQQLMNRAARSYRVFFVEEARPLDGHVAPHLEVIRHPTGVRGVVPYLPSDVLGEPRHEARRAMLADLFARYDIQHYILWYYTPAALPFTRHLEPLATIYDSTEALASLDDAPLALSGQAVELLHRADLVLADSPGLYEALRDRHSNVHLFPSAFDVEHFMQARAWQPQPADQVDIPHPRLGFFGVIDERLDWVLIEELAAARPDWNLVLLGSLDKIDATQLPRRANLHYLGPKSYLDLPAYLAGWDAALLPFALTEAPLYIGRAKAPEYLAAGIPVVSTPIREIVQSYGEAGLIRIAAAPRQFVAAVEASLNQEDLPAGWLQRVDAFLAQTSWDSSWQGIARLIEGVINIRHAPALARARIAQAHLGELLSDELTGLDQRNGTARR